MLSETEKQLALQIQTACSWECCARKPGNVHPMASFQDLHFTDFLLGASSIAPILAQAGTLGIGQSILQAVQASRAMVGSNCNLGIILLLAPLAAVRNPSKLGTEVKTILKNTTVEDAKLVYEAIRIANPGGLGEAPEEDVRNTPKKSLLTTMQMASHRDSIARQYDSGFEDIFLHAIPTLGGALELLGSLEAAILFTHLYLMSKFPDTLILRKQGESEARESAERANKVLQLQWPLKEPGWAEFRELDRWLRAKGNSRNPGATADMVAATLFAALRTGQLPLPCPFPWTSGMEQALRRSAPDCD